MPPKKPITDPYAVDYDTLMRDAKDALAHANAFEAEALPKPTPAPPAPPPDPYKPLREVGQGIAATLLPAGWNDWEAAKEGISYSVQHPVDAFKLIVGADKEARDKEYQLSNRSAMEQSPVEKWGHRVASYLPMIGPGAASAGESFAEGEGWTGLGKTLGLLGPIAVHEALPTGEATPRPTPRPYPRRPNFAAGERNPASVRSTPLGPEPPPRSLLQMLFGERVAPESYPTHGRYQPIKGVAGSEPQTYTQGPARTNPIGIKTPDPSLRTTERVPFRPDSSSVDLGLPEGFDELNRELGDLNSTERPLPPEFAELNEIINQPDRVMHGPERPPAPKNAGGRLVPGGGRLSEPPRVPTAIQSALAELLGVKESASARVPSPEAPVPEATVEPATKPAKPRVTASEVANVLRGREKFAEKNPGVSLEPGMRDELDRSGLEYGRTQSELKRLLGVPDADPAEVARMQRGARELGQHLRETSNRAKIPALDPELQALNAELGDLNTLSSEEVGFSGGEMPDSGMIDDAGVEKAPASPLAKLFKAEQPADLSTLSDEELGIGRHFPGDTVNDLGIAHDAPIDLEQALMEAQSDMAKPVQASEPSAPKSSFSALGKALKASGDPVSGFSKKLAEELNYRLDLMEEMAESEGEPFVRDDSAVYQAIRDMENGEGIPKGFKRELNQWQIDKGVYRPMSAEEIANTEVSGRPGSKKWDLVHNGQKYKFERGITGNNEEMGMVGGEEPGIETANDSPLGRLFRGEPAPPGREGHFTLPKPKGILPESEQLRMLEETPARAEQRYNEVNDRRVNDVGRAAGERRGVSPERQAEIQAEMDQVASNPPPAGPSVFDAEYGPLGRFFHNLAENETGSIDFSGAGRPTEQGMRELGQALGAAAQTHQAGSLLFNPLTLAKIAASNTISSLQMGLEHSAMEGSLAPLGRVARELVNPQMIRDAIDAFKNPHDLPTRESVAPKVGGLFKHGLKAVGAVDAPFRNAIERAGLPSEDALTVTQQRRPVSTFGQRAVDFQQSSALSRLLIPFLKSRVNEFETGITEPLQSAGKIITGDASPRDLVKVGSAATAAAGGYFASKQIDRLPRPLRPLAMALFGMYGAPAAIGYGASHLDQGVQGAYNAALNTVPLAQGVSLDPKSQVSRIIPKTLNPDYWTGTKRIARTFWDKIKSQIPGAAQTLPEDFGPGPKHKRRVE